MKTVGEKLDSLLNQQIHDYCDRPEYEACLKCNGRGWIYYQPSPSHRTYKAECPVCSGEGRIPITICPDCNKTRCECDDED
jgi:DnaJ-class molecular chaperone